MRRVSLKGLRILAACGATFLVWGCGSGGGGGPKVHDISLPNAQVSLTLDSEWEPAEPYRPGEKVWKNHDLVLTFRPVESEPGATLLTGMKRWLGNPDMPSDRVAELASLAKDHEFDELAADYKASADAFRDDGNPYSDPREVKWARFEEEIGALGERWNRRPELQAELMAFAMNLRPNQVEALTIGPNEVLLTRNRPLVYFRPGGQLCLFELEGVSAEGPEWASQKLLSCLQTLAFDPPDPATAPPLVASTPLPAASPSPAASPLPASPLPAASPMPAAGPGVVPSADGAKASDSSGNWVGFLILVVAVVAVFAQRKKDSAGGTTESLIS